jgi:Leucine-rich repeat (LRR) protein
LRADVLLSNTLFEELDDGITPEFLRHHTGNNNLEEVDFLEMQVDAVSGCQKVECLGEFMPNLRHMRLNQSSVCTIRDLGTSYSQLRVLWVCRSALQDLGGITAMPVLEELYISFNDIRDLSPLYTHDTLQVLDVEGNLIEEFDEIASLQTVITLRELTISGNPVCKTDGFSRAGVFEALPHIEVLDDIPCAEKAPAPLQDLELADADEDAAFLASLKEDKEFEDFLDPATSGSDREELRGLSDIGQLLEEEDMAKENESSEAVAELRKSFALLRAETASSGGRSPIKSSPVKSAGGEAEEPSEQDLIIENLKRSRKPVPNVWNMQAMSARSSQQTSSTGRPCTGFFPDRRMKTAWSPDGHCRPQSSCGSFATCSTMPSTSAAYSVAEDSDPNSSDLTMGDDGASLAGNALSAIRRRRKVAKDRGADEHNIRDMLRKFETFKQESCLPQAELELRRRHSETKRPGTSDVRVSAPRLLTSGGRSVPLPSSLPGAPGESWVTRTPAAKRPDSRGSTRRRLEPELREYSDFLAPTFSTEHGEALIIN